MDQPVNQRDYTSGIGEDFVPFCERTVGSDQGGFDFIAAVNDLEQQVSMTIGVRQVPELVDDQ